MSENELNKGIKLLRKYLEIGILILTIGLCLIGTVYDKTKMIQLLGLICIPILFLLIIYISTFILQRIFTSNKNVLTILYLDCINILAIKYILNIISYIYLYILGIYEFTFPEDTEHITLGLNALSNYNNFINILLIVMALVSVYKISRYMKKQKNKKQGFNMEMKE